MHLCHTREHGLGEIDYKLMISNLLDQLSYFNTLVHYWLKSFRTNKDIDQSVGLETALKKS